MSNEARVPKSPEPELLNSEDETNLLKWIQYFKHLSPRIKVIEPSEVIFSECLNSIRSTVINILEIQENEKLIDWPKENECAFIVFIDTSKPGQKERFAYEDAIVFCFGNTSFGTRYHFAWDGDAEENNWQQLILYITH